MDLFKLANEQLQEAHKQGEVFADYFDYQLLDAHFEKFGKPGSLTIDVYFEVEEGAALEEYREEAGIRVIKEWDGVIEEEKYHLFTKEGLEKAIEDFKKKKEELIRNGYKEKKEENIA